MEAVVKNIARAGLILFLFFEIVAGLGFIVLQPTFTWLGLAITSGGVLLSLEASSRFLGFLARPLLPAVVYFASFTGVGVDAVGDIFRFYALIDQYDRYAHFVAGLAVGIFIFYLIPRLFNAESLSRWPLFIFMLALVLSIAFIYEVEEYVEDRWSLGWSGLRRLGDGPDTVEDLLLTLAGGGLALTMLFWYKRRESLGP